MKNKIDKKKTNKTKNAQKRQYEEKKLSKNTIKLVLWWQTTTPKRGVCREVLRAILKANGQ